MDFEKSWGEQGKKDMTLLEVLICNWYRLQIMFLKKKNLPGKFYTAGSTILSLISGETYTITCNTKASYCRKVFKIYWHVIGKRYHYATHKRRNT
jgi:hypothetical protein